MPIDLSPIASTMINGVKYYQPKNENEVMLIVNKAHETKGVVCLRGAAHSHPTIESLESEADAGRLYIYMSNMREVTFNDQLMQVTAQGGCNLGYDPQDPAGVSNWENSLLQKVDNKGWSFPDLGGIVHQTVGGFLSTGSSGSNLNASYNEQLVSITLITGGPNGAQKQTFSRNDPNYPDPEKNPFYAAGVSMGMFGVIISATFQCGKNFNIAGQEITTLTGKSGIDLFGDRPDLTPLAEFFRKHTYKRIMWWPQQGVDKAVAWSAEPVAYSKENLKPYQEIPEIKIGPFKTPLPLEFAADLMMRGFGDIKALLDKWKNSNNLIEKALSQILAKVEEEKVVPFLLNEFVSDKPDPNNNPQKFNDLWYKGIPMDNRIHDRLLPVWFTELWFPIDKGHEVLSTLRKFFQDNPDEVRTFSYEIYPAKASEFWLSPAYRMDVFRIDLFWFAYNPGSPRDEFYPTLWNLLRPLVFRPHWGKFIPMGTYQDDKDPSKTKQWSDYIRSQYPKFNDWEAIRRQLDPHQVFVSNYWRDVLNIEKPAS